jgi:hypothetical protein
MSLVVNVYHINNIRCGVVIFIETDARERMLPCTLPDFTAANIESYLIRIVDISYVALY